ncbi:fibronectin type III domain-containing protein [Lactococcus lactis]|uniref:fibronectin type III domain-containing protein n=1 Tax=Lactococcus lactis TaxID=1358 RepID=UPI00240F9ED6|nr:fibronectin type III domain-containing protein [Lactococcus lactis]
MADKNYLHTAYANSADGTDGFTTVYPNLNLLKGTRVPISLTGKNTINQRELLWQFDNGKNVQNQNLSLGDTITCKFDWTVTNPTSGTFLVQLNDFNWKYLSQIISITSENKSGHSEFSFVVDSNFLSGIANGVQLRIDNLPTDSVLTISNLLFTKGSTDTPYIPSASEVTTADWPKFVGTYVDTNPVSSMEPSKYDWDEMKYRVYLDGTPVGGSKLLSFDLENLKAGTSYNVQVSQINGNVESDKSESVAFKTTLPK